jgi:hypothetical protein
VRSPSSTSDCRAARICWAPSRPSPTREIEDFTGSPTVAKDWLGYLDNACIDPWRGQVPFIITESRSLAGVLRDMCADYRIRIASTNGQVGGFLHTELAPRLSEGDRVGYLGDLDLAGGDIGLIRRCAVLTVQLEMLEQKFAQARGDAAPAELDLYQKIANTLRRHLSTLGLQRRAKDVGPTLGDLIRQDQQANRERLARERAEDAPS